MAVLVKDSNGDFVPQHLSPDNSVYYPTKGNLYGGQFITPINNNGDELFTNTTPGNMQLIGNTLEEQLTQANASSGVLTFQSNIVTIEIYNTDATNDGTFVVNGISIHVPKGQVFKATLGGTTGKTVTVSGATTYIVSRYE
jgi:hypothetical protein